MKGYRFSGILTNTSWVTPAYVDIDVEGNLTSISQEPLSNRSYENVNGYALPGITNAHSHAFQYAMVGLTEKHNYSAQNFWSWRKKMYELALTVGPEDLESIATMLYAEMSRHGYTHVCEFHYLHHDKNGNYFDNKAELGHRLLRAAEKAGIKITLIPIFYQKGGFGCDPLLDQRRFISSNVEDYKALWEASKEACLNYKNAFVAHGIHSLRAVANNDVSDFISAIEDELPIHMHIAEQLKEVEESIQYLGCRPVEWMLDNIDIDKRFHLVHATHMTQQETAALARTGAHVVLCPSTEGNLGDGLFNLDLYQQSGGNWSIGTDSHIGLNPMEELRLLDYCQRVHTHQRSTFYNSEFEDSGDYALNQMITSGRRSAGMEISEYFKIGKSFDALVINALHPIIDCTSTHFLSSTIVYSADPVMYLGTMINGQWVVQTGRHRNSDLIFQEFSKTMKSLKYR